jgi:hypothetical protein
MTLPIARNTIPKIYEGQMYQVPQTRFGEIGEAPLFDIRNGEAYPTIPAAMRQAVGKMRQGKICITEDGGFREVDIRTFDALNQLPLPDVCRGCYKALGI